MGGGSGRRCVCFGWRKKIWGRLAKRGTPWISLGALGQPLCHARREPAGERGEPNDVAVVPQVVVSRAHMGAADGIGEVQRQGPAGKLDIVVGDGGNVAHLTELTVLTSLTGYSLRPSVASGQAGGSD